MAENTVFLILTAIIHNFYKLLMQDEGIKDLTKSGNETAYALYAKFLLVSGNYHSADTK